MPISWDISYSVGHPLLDRQHQHLMELCNRAAVCAERGQVTGEFHELLNELAEYAEEHFATEEKLLEECNYPQLKQHKAEHEAYQEKLTEILYSATFRLLEKDQLSRNLGDWWKGHILGSDREYASYL